MSHSEKLDFALTALLSHRFETINEFDLIKQLQQPPYKLFVDVNLTDSLILFQVHFALYNALYRLRDHWLAEQTAIINIKLSAIHIQPFTAVNQAVEALVCSDPLRHYYLDWRNFDNTGKAQVESLLDSFWLKMSAYIVDDKDKVNALSILQLESSASELTSTVIKKAYKRLSLQYHPDKGGSLSQMQQLQWAYQLLAKMYS